VLFDSDAGRDDTAIFRLDIRSVLRTLAGGCRILGCLTRIFSVLAVRAFGF
jgi:hypothetical protein